MLVQMAGPFILRSRPDVIQSEAQFRANLNLAWVSGIIFNAVVERNAVGVAEYDALMYDRDGVLFLEYKDSRNAYQNMAASDAQRHHDVARLVARALGFSRFSYKIIVNEITKRSLKGGCEVIPLIEVENYTPEWENTWPEKMQITNIIRRNREFLRKTKRTGNADEANFETVEGEADRVEKINRDLETLLKLIDEAN